VYRWRRVVLMVVMPLFVMACNVQVRKSPAPVPASAARAASHWSQVLQRFVDDQGRVNFMALALQRADLDAYIAWIEAVSPHNHPQRFPTTASRLAYHINSYNALAMYNVLDAGLPASLSGLAKVEFFVLRKQLIGGRRISLYDYENEVIRPLRDARVHFVLNCMAVSCPRLPREAFAADSLEAALDHEARRFFAESRNLSVDDAARSVTLSEILDFYAEDFMAQAPSLQAYVRRYHDGPVPDDYAVRFKPYDWTVNHQP
jgi:hypothetical protein